MKTRSFLIGFLAVVALGLAGGCTDEAPASVKDGLTAARVVDQAGQPWPDGFEFWRR